MASSEDICCICLRMVEEQLLHFVTQDYIKKLACCVPSQTWFMYFKICEGCSWSLNEAYNFIQKCIESQNDREKLLFSTVKEDIEENDEKHDTIFEPMMEINSYQIKIDDTSDNNLESFDSDVSDDKDDLPLATLKNNTQIKDSKIKKEDKADDLEIEEHVNIVKLKIKRKKDQTKSRIDKEILRGRRGRTKKIKTEPPPKRRKQKLPVTCEYCQRIFHHRQSYELHVRTNHTFEKPFECDLCPAKFVRNQNLMIHRRKHTNERPYICDTCGKDFASSGNLSHHSKIHLNKREYQCDMCDKSFNKSGNLSAHKLVVHSKPEDWKFVCEVCSKKFPVKGGLVLHMQRHVGKKEDVCHICKKEFLNKYELKRHMLSHSSNLSFDCTVCREKTFKTKYGLRRHLAFTHDIGKIKYWKAEKKYACHVCPKMFTNNFKLKKHLNTHSNEKSPEKPFSMQLENLDKVTTVHHVVSQPNDYAASNYA